MKHEQAILVSLAYVIGFTTAFIAFALTNTHTGIKSNYETLSLAATSAEELTLTHSDFLVENREEGLILVTNGEERIISARNSGEEPENGFHYEIVSYVVSPDKDYIYYCASMVLENNTCTSYIYSVSDHSVYLLKDENGVIELDGHEAIGVTWLSDVSINVSGKTASLDSGWVLR